MACAAVAAACVTRVIDDEAPPLGTPGRAGQSSEPTLTLDARAPHRAVPRPTCLGPSIPLTLAGQVPYVTVTVGRGDHAREGAFLVDFGSTLSVIDPAAFVPTAPVASTCTSPEASAGRPQCTYDAFDFFGSWGAVTLYRDDFSSLHMGVVQAGILGTDFLSVHPFTLDYENERLHASHGLFCSDAQLERAGLVALSSAGFYATDMSSLRPLSEVMTPLDGAAPGSVPNIPTVPLRVGGVIAHAQLDTGFDDVLVAHAINVNEALVTAILANDPAAIERDESADLSLTTCIAGLRENVEAYRVAPHHPAELLDERGGVARSEPNAVLFVKKTPPGARVCGGIGTWREPAAQLAASYFKNAGLVAFDPRAGRVWIPRSL